jgi:gamma-glutamyltranspeptidase/glutathione hydrolase
MRNLRPTVLTLVLTISLAAATHAASVAPVAAKNGMVVTAQEYATRVGVDVLRSGGNAIDAAVAVGYALAAVYPAAGNLGGGGFMTLQLADGRKTFIDFREVAPLAATATMYLDASGNVIPDLSTRGHLAVAVPGTVSGLEYARAKYGTMTRARLIAPAITLADKGFVLTQGDVDILGEGTDDFRKDPASAAIFLDQGQPLKPGATLRQRHLAATLRNISQRGTDGSTRAHRRRAHRLEPRRQGNPHAGGSRRLSNARARTVECDYRGFHIVAPPPPSSGGIVLCEMLNILEGYPLRDYGYGSARSVHFEIEAMRHAYVDRNHLLGDPCLCSQSRSTAARPNATRATSRADRPAARRRTPEAQARHRRARRHTHHALFDRGPLGNACRSRTRSTTGSARASLPRHGRAAQQRDGRLHAQAGVRTCTAWCRASPTDRTGQAAAELDDSDHRLP